MNTLPDRIFHMADAGNWASIMRDGLLSAEALVRRAGLDTNSAASFLSYRDGSRTLPSGEIVRDQRPMPPGALARCLDPGLKPADWYALVNSMVFFWLDPERLDRHRRACAARPQIVMVIDVRALAARHGERAFVTPFNTGNARRHPARRGRRTFTPLKHWLEHGWLGEAAPGEAPRKPTHRPAEFTVRGSVPDILSFVVETRRLAPGEAFARPK
jgi:hypothetical protein